MYLFRAIGDEPIFDPITGEQLDIFAKNPDDDQYTWIDCINDMSSRCRTRFIPTTQRIIVASEKYGNHIPRNGKVVSSTRSPIIMIDTDLIDSQSIIDPKKQPSPEEIKKRPTKKEMADYRKAISLAAANGGQVLIEKKIPKESYVVIPPLLVDILAAMQMEIGQLERTIKEVKKELDGVDSRDKNLENQKRQLIEKKRNSENEMKRLQEDIRKLEEEMKGASGRDLDRIVKDIEHKESLINQRKREIANAKKQRKEIEKRMREALTKDDYKEELKRLRQLHEKVNAAFEELQTRVMNGEGKELEEMFLEGCDFEEVESLFVDAYYRSYDSMGEVAKMIDDATGKRRKNADGIDAATALRQGVVKNVMDSEDFRTILGLEDDIKIGDNYRVAPHGSFKLSAEADKRYRVNKNIVPLGGSADDIFFVEKGTRLVEEYQLSSTPEGRIRIDIKYNDGTYGSMEMNVERFKELIAKNRRADGVGSAGDGATPSGIAGVGEIIEDGVNSRDDDDRDDHDS